MITIKKCLFAATILSVSLAPAQKCIKLKPVKWTSVRVPEPSDICFNPKNDSFFIVSDNGILSETDHEGKVIRTVIQKNADFEAVYSDGLTVYVVDESHRTIYMFDSATLKVSRTVTIPYSGARNKGYEAIAFNKSKNTMVLLTEKEPVYLFELDADFRIKNQIELKIASDISAATYYNDALWLLSDQDMTLFKINPNTYEILRKWSLPVINPEGLAFDKDGNLLITCDDMQRIYYFNNPEKS